jgi:hypothetical protein
LFSRFTLVGLFPLQIVCPSNEAGGDAPAVLRILPEIGKMNLTQISFAMQLIVSCHVKTTYLFEKKNHVNEDVACMQPGIIPG